MNYDYIGDDNSVIEQCLIVQEPFGILKARLMDKKPNHVFTRNI